jgi:uridine kinase
MSQLATVLDLIHAASAGRALTLVGIGGRGGSGKSTLANAIEASRPDVQLVQTDAFWNGSQFDLPRLRTEVVEALLRGRTAAYDAWDWAAHAAAGRRALVPNGVVVIEGVCALHEMFRHDLDVRIWVDAPSELRLARGVARDGEASRTTWTEVWMPSEDAYVARDNPIPCAHLVIDGAIPY